MTSLQLDKRELGKYLDAKYHIFLPSWDEMRAKVEAGTTKGCRSCKGRKIAWREFLRWYPGNTKALGELKALTHCSKIEFWNTLSHPPKKVII